MDSTHDAPSRIPWPPLLLAGSIALAFTIDWWLVPLPFPLAEVAVVRAVGLLLLIAALAVIAWSTVEFGRHATTVRPDRPSTALIQSGPFAWSRNPIYLAETVGLLAAAIVWNMMALVFVAPLFVVAVTALAIRREEAFLARRFGATYDDYCSRVPRWF